MSDVVVIKDRKGTRIGQVTLNLGESTATVLFLKNQVTKISKSFIILEKHHLISEYVNYIFIAKQTESLPSDNGLPSDKSKKNTFLSLRG